MANQRTSSGSDRSPSAPTTLTATEQAEVLARLVARHPEVAGDAETIATDLLARLGRPGVVTRRR